MFKKSSWGRLDVLKGAIMMKKYLVGLMFSMVLPVQAQAAHVDFNVGVNVGVPAAPVYVAPPVTIAQPPEFVAPPELGFYVAVGVPYDLYFYDNRYWLWRSGAWYSAPFYNGPWVTVGINSVPYGIRRFPFERIHYYRDNYFRHYHGVGGPEYRHFRPGRHEMGREGRGPGKAENHGRAHEGHGDGKGEGHGRWER